MSSTYQIGSVCEECLQYGKENYLKPFYINLDEQIIKCQSSSCMFPYLRKPIMSDLTNSKPSESTIFLDEFIEQSLKEIDNNPAKTDTQTCPAKLEPITSDMYDFSSIFMDNHIKTEIKEKPFGIQIVKQEQIAHPVVLETKLLTNSGNIHDSKQKAIANSKRQIQPPQKSRISRCLSDVKTSSKSSNAKRSKAPCEKIEPVLVIEPHSGKSMRPLDLIKRYFQNK